MNSPITRRQLLASASASVIVVVLSPLLDNAAADLHDSETTEPAVAYGSIVGVL
jgi:hypothetical protein